MNSYIYEKNDDKIRIYMCRPRRFVTKQRHYESKQTSIRHALVVLRNKQTISATGVCNK